MVLMAWLLRMARRGLIGLFLVAVVLLGVRAWDSQRGAPLDVWHEYVPAELSAADLDTADWADWQDAEARVFAEVETAVTQALDPEDRVADNRYFSGSPVHPAGFARDWNRSYVDMPDGAIRGAVVLLHGLTDSPYSLRHVGDLYRRAGFVVVAIRLPGHGTVPAALTDATSDDWQAATALAVREARRQAGPDVPLHLVGYSNGGALALTYALDTLDDASLARPDRLVLISPMIGITAFARFAGLAGLPAILPAFAKAAWLSILPEFNPFKYNSFPVQAARQSYEVTQVLQRRIREAAEDGRLRDLPPVLAFQSVVDSTVSTRAVVEAFFDRLPANGSELVLFDLNRSATFGPLFRTVDEDLADTLLPRAPRAYRATIIGNAGRGSVAVVARTTEAGASREEVTPLDLTYPSDVFSMSHVALPFPVDDGLYGLEPAPDPAEDFGVRLGATATRGEQGTLIIALDALMRITSNPFFPYLAARVTEAVEAESAP
ncbi:alpha/beta hydrolase [Marinivivus vitaminiproducens]|uniref:alpha/beta hydrolase n=1 Tax=Marinivivus vitaminiproducens TaxID=3035935 RepID=UPI0027A7D68C|nr:alpha/beta hydrolase [Geminicoccaceae bacterium SCSIO 64248]